MLFIHLPQTPIPQEKGKEKKKKEADLKKKPAKYSNTQKQKSTDHTKHYLDSHRSPSVERCHHCSQMARAVRSEPELPSAGNASAPLKHQSYRQTPEWDSVDIIPDSFNKSWRRYPKGCEKKSVSLTWISDQQKRSQRTAERLPLPPPKKKEKKRWYVTVANIRRLRKYYKGCTSQLVIN